MIGNLFLLSRSSQVAEGRKRSLGTLGLDLGVYGVPETFLIDARGTIVYKHIGPLSPQTYKNLMEKHLTKKQ